MIQSGKPVFTLNNQTIYARAIVDRNGDPDTSGGYISDKYKTPVFGFVGISTGIVKDGYLKVYIINKLDTYPDGSYQVVTELAWVWLQLVTSTGNVTKQISDYQRIYLENETSGTLPGNDGSGFIPGAGLAPDLELKGLKWLLIIVLGIMIVKD